MLPLIKYAKALGDETRARIINILLHHELNVGELVSILAMGQPRISRHLKILTDADLLESRRDGLWIFYRTSQQGTSREFLDKITHFFHGDLTMENDLQRALKTVQERTSSTSKFFDSIAHSWEHLQNEILGDFDLAAQILKAMPDSDVAVDLGCGAGNILPILAKRALTVIGVDNSPKMLDLASQKINSIEKISLRLGEMTHLPLRDAEANFALMSMTLHHISIPQKALDEAGRILQPKGKLIVADYAKHGNEIMRVKYGDHWLGFSKSEMKFWLQKAHFSIRNIYSYPVNQGIVLDVYECIKK